MTDSVKTEKKKDQKLSTIIDNLGSEETTSNAILQYLKQKGKKHTALYHYTNLSSCKAIIKSKYLRLSNICKLNDHLEINGIPKGEQGKYFIMSLQYGFNENVAMWHMYALPYRCGARLKISTSSLAGQLDSAKAYKVNQNSKSLESIELEIDSIFLSDILYTGIAKEKNFKVIKKGAEDVAIISDDYHDKIIGGDLHFRGLIKDAAWVYENEVRLIVKLKNDPETEHIGIKFIDSSFFDNIQITTGPYVNYKEYSFEEFLNITVNKSLFMDTIVQPKCDASFESCSLSTKPCKNEISK